jgi:predicted GIY-YIG superfamily endonuclease
MKTLFQTSISGQVSALPEKRFLINFYVIECEDGSYYIGHTDNIQRRWSEHKKGTAAEWTKAHKPVNIVHYEEFESREDAVEREKWLKTGYGRQWIKREIKAGRARQAGGTPLDEEQCRRLFSVPASVDGVPAGGNGRKRLASAIKKRRDAILEQIGTRNAAFFDQEMEKLDHWAGDRRATLKTDLKEMDDQIKELKKQVRLSSSLPEKIELQKKVKVLDKKRDDAWREYDVAAKEIEIRKDELIDAVEARLKQNITETPLFEIEWEVR